MKILQVQFKNRNGHTLRGIVTLPDTEGKVPFVVHLHGFAGSCSGYKSMYTHLSRALAAQGIGSARFDFYGNGESDGEFEDMSFDGLHTDAQDIFAWAAEQPYVDSEKLFLSGQSMGGYIAASCAPAVARVTVRDVGDTPQSGDVNWDGAVNVEDMQALFGHLCGESPLTGELLTAADFNGDGAVDILDYQAMYMWIQSLQAG